MCVLACVFSLSLSRAQRALSLSLRRASFHSSLAQIHALGAAFKRKPVHSPSQSDMGLTRSNRFLDSVRVRDFWGLRFFLIFYFLHRSSWNESGRKKKEKEKMVIWVMIILSTAATANGEWRTAGGGRPWVEAILIVKKMRDVSGEMKKCEKRNGGRERARPWPGRRVIQMKLEAYEKCVFLALKCTSTGHILWRTIRVRQSERERGGRRRKATWKPPETTSFILVLQFSIIKIIFARKVRPAFSVSFFFFFLSGPIVRFLSAPFCFDIKRDYTVSRMQFRVFFFVGLLLDRKWCWGHSSSP